MNDEHREDSAVTGWSSGGNGTSTATAEPIDRRWFEEALRAQGFLVEAPTTDDEVGVVEPRSAVLDTGPTDLALHDEPAAVAGQPVAAVVEATAVTRPETVAAEHASEPWDLPSSRPPVAPVAKPVPVTEPGPGWPRIGDIPSRVASATTRPALVSPSATPASPTVRQAVAPTTLPEARPPVPTPELAARLARSTSRPIPAAIEGTAPAAPVVVTAAAVEVASTVAEPAAAVAADEPVVSASRTPAVEVETVGQEPAVAVEATPSAVPSTTAVSAADPWTLPALQADLAAERRSGSATADGDLAPFVVAAATAPVVAVASPAAPAPSVASPVLPTPVADDPAASTAEATARQEADLQAQAVATDIVATDATVAPVSTGQAAVPLAPNVAPVAALGVASATDAGSITDTDVAPAPAEDHDEGATPTAAASAAVVSGSPGTRPAAGIAAIAHRPPAASTDTPVDGGDSDLWGLVDDPRKAAASATTTTRPTAGSRVTTLILTVFVAIVVVVLVLGFLYLLGQLV